MIRRLRKLAYKTAIIAATFFALSVTALAADDSHIRGKISAINGTIVTVETVAGQSVDVTMADEYTLLLYKKFAFEDLEPNLYLGVPSAPASDGGKRALAVAVFPEAMRGSNEGEGSWDLVPGSRMTNASLAKLEGTDVNRKITVSFRDKSQVIDVPENTPVVTFSPVKDRRLAVGDNTVIFAKEDENRLKAELAGISKDGSLPPI